MADDSRISDVLVARRGQALVGIPGVEDGEEVIYYRLANRPVNDEARAASIERALAAAGAWSDLGVDETLDALDRIRHSNPPSPPLELED